MHRYVLLSLALISVVQANRDLDLGPPPLAPQIAEYRELYTAQPPGKYKMEDVMPPLKHLSQRKRVEYSENCKALGASCKLAEECCSELCLKYSRRCTI